MMARRNRRPRHAICIVVDGLRAAALGAYGGCGVATPWFDRLASESIVANSMWAAGCSLNDFYNAVGSGQHGIRLAVSDDDQAHDDLFQLFQSLRDHEVKLLGVTDDRTLASRWQHSGPIKVDLLDSVQTESATTVDETHFAQLFAVAADSMLDASHIEDDRLIGFTRAGGTARGTRRCTSARRCWTKMIRQPKRGSSRHGMWKRAIRSATRISVGIRGPGSGAGRMHRRFHGGACRESCR